MTDTTEAQMGDGGGQMKQHKRQRENTVAKSKSVKCDRRVGAYTCAINMLANGVNYIFHIFMHMLYLNY